MIVKNEAHIIAGTLEHLLKYIQFDYWVISDTGSTDATKEIIVDFFKAKNIPGELDETPWKDFGYNRTVAFERAYKKTDYVFVWDADDEVYGNFVMPTDLTADLYKFIFGSDNGFRYSRCQLFNNHKKWMYKGVLHEYAMCTEPTGPMADVLGDYYFISGRKGDRSKDPNKYLKDAIILEKAFAEAFEKKDPLYNRYCFYCAQSYNSCNMHEKAIEYYKKALTLDLWVQERYMSCLEIYDQYELIKKPEEGLRFLVESYSYDSTRVEGIYRLVKYYCINGSADVAYMYYTLIKDFFETKYIGTNLADKLFAKQPEYDFYLPYYMIIVSDRSKHHETAAKMFEIISKQQCVVGEWWIHNFIHNCQFFIHTLPLDLNVLENFLQYIEKLRKSGVSFQAKHLEIIDKIIAHYRPTLAKSTKTLTVNKRDKVRVMLTITTCKRFDLFQQTMNSMLSLWSDIDKVDYWYCVDDNSSSEDRIKMQAQYPFFNYYMKSSNEKGHRESMNMIWSKLEEIKPTYWIHMEDDWLYFKNEAYITRAIQCLEKYKNLNIHQVVFNKTYGLMFADLDRIGSLPLEPGLVLHDKREGLVGKNCGYWPHYSLQPSVVRTEVILKLGNYDSANTFFERDYANKYYANGYKTAFFDSIYSLHIGKQHWEKDGQNAYSLNQVGQFKVETPSNAVPETTIEIMKTDEPLVGNMTNHLNALLDKIRAGVHFGLIRPSDGEYTILKGQSLTNCDNWTFKSGGKLQEQLAKAVQTVDKNLYIGIPCNTCNKPWNCTDTIYNDFINTFKVPLAQRTYANIVGNANWPIFSEFLKGYTKGFYLITSGTKETELPIKDRFIIDNCLVNNWDTEGESETKRLLEYISSKNDQLICFSAGPLSKVWIPMCMKANPSNTYFDVGASIDIFTKGTTNRLYTNKDHPFSKEVCVFKDALIKPSLKMKGYSDVFDKSVSQFKVCTDKSKLFSSFRGQRDIYGFTENGDVCPDQEAINIAKNIDSEQYDKYLTALDGRKAVGYYGTSQNFAKYNNLDSRHIMMSVFAFNKLPSNIDTIVEVGGGYGNWFLLNSKVQNFKKWITIDLPHVSELQRWYLTETECNIDNWESVSAYDYSKVKDLNIDLLIGSHSLSELSIDLFDEYFKSIICNSKYFLYCYHMTMPTIELITAKNKSISSCFTLIDSVKSENGTVLNSLYLNNKYIKHTNLLYFCVFHNKEYAEFLKSLLISLKYYSTLDTIDILVYTSDEFEPYIKSCSNDLNIPITIKIAKYNSTHEAACARLYIFDYENIDQYSKILYLDTDILVQGDLTTLFTLELDDILYAKRENVIGREQSGGTFFDFDTIDRNTPAINSGVLLFNNSKTIRSLFDEVKTHIVEMRNSGERMPHCMDQPFINYHFVKNNKYNHTLLESQVTLYSFEGSLPTQGILAHFIESNKHPRILRHLKNILNTFPVNSSITNSVIGKKYNWNSGFIKFENNNSLLTYWGKGTYTLFDEYTFNVTWNGYSHIFKLNSTYDTYISVNINSYEIICGSIIT